MRMRRTDKELAPARDQNVSLLTQAIAQLFARFRCLDVARYFHVVILAFVSTCAGDVGQDTFSEHAGVTHVQRTVNPPLFNRANTSNQQGFSSRMVAQYLLRIATGLSGR